MAFLGPNGTFTHEAASSLDGELVSYCSIPSVMKSVVDGTCFKGIVPIENSVEGPVGITLDFLANQIDLNIEKEIIIPINHNLLIDKESNKENISVKDVKEVYSHSQALAQCQNYLEIHNIKTHFTLSTAAAAKSIKGVKKIGAIGTLKAAEIYGLDVLDRNIQDIKNNETRFVILSKNKSKITNNDKTSILFSLFEDNPGGLHDILGIFAENNVNLTKIESRPSKEGLGKYIFFVDFEGHQDNDIIKDILNIIETKTSFMKVLGSYPIAK
ncbi:MAG: prephenate dehydratase [Methanobrevibacter sp.]|nr:prephenate dehydratase [Methanobrevibacter sp.]